MAPETKSFNVKLVILKFVRKRHQFKDPWPTLESVSRSVSQPLCLAVLYVRYRILVCMAEPCPELGLDSC